MPPLQWRNSPDDPGLPALLRNRAVELVNVAVLKHVGQHLKGAPGTGIERTMVLRCDGDSRPSL